MTLKGEESNRATVDEEYECAILNLTPYQHRKKKWRKGNMTKMAALLNEAS